MDQGRHVDSKPQPESQQPEESLEDLAPEESETADIKGGGISMEYKPQSADGPRTS